MYLLVQGLHQLNEYGVENSLMVSMSLVEIHKCVSIVEGIIVNKSLQIYSFFVL